MEHPSLYHYTPLQHPEEIRLLTVEPGPDSEHISCTIEHVVHDETSQKEYFALSYEWGPEDGMRRSLLVNGAPVAVRENLWQALWHLRKQTPRLKFNPIWIDALCVNQYDTRERNHQVRLMAKTYRRAKEVFAWLGPFATTPNSPWYDEKELRDGYSESMVALQNASGISSAEGLASERGRKNSPTEVLSALLERPYWHRMWIVQEVTLASKVTLMRGQYKIDSEILSGFRQLYMREYSPEMQKTLLYEENDLKIRRQSPTSVPELVKEDGYLLSLDPDLMRQKHLQRVVRGQGSILDEHRQSLRKNTLEELLWTCQRSMSSDPRDKIYALLGLAVDCQNDEITVDYSKSLFDVYTDVVKFYCASHSCARDQYPDYIVQFSQFLQRMMGSMLELEEGAKKHKKLPDSVSPEWIKARGILTGKVAKLRIAPDRTQASDCDSKDAMRFSKQFIDSFLKVSSIDGNDSFGIQARDIPAGLEGPAALQTRLGTGSQGEKAPRILNFKMENGRAGIISANALKGDIICRFWGSDVCAVLRRDPEGPSYGVVGRAIIPRSPKERLLRECVTTARDSWTESSHSFPDYDKDSAWQWETIYLQLDILTLQQLTR